MMRMSKMAVVIVAAALALGAGLSRTVAAEGEPRTGELNGTVVSVETVKAENDIVRYSLTITTEAGAKEKFTVGPGNAKAYATVKGLKADDKVRLAWVTERNEKWIKAIRKL